METFNASSSKSEIRDACLRAFGPRVELVRVSARNRNERFVISNGVFRVDGRVSLPVVLGAGDSWLAAYNSSVSSDLGQRAIEEHKSSIDMMKLASQSASAVEFADKLADNAIAEARSIGASDEEIELMKAKFDEARKMINDHTDDKPEEAVRGQEGHASPGADHEGAGAEDQR